MKALALILFLIASTPDKFIILTERQARELRGRHGQYSELQPVKLVGGEYVLPVKVLENDEFLKIREQLKKLPQREVKAEEFPKSEETP